MATRIDPGGEEETPAKHKKLVVGMIAAALVAVVVVGVYVVVAHGAGTAPAAAGPAKVQTVAVKKTDLANTQSFTGTLGFGAPQVLKGAGAGTVTKLPKTGDVLQRGQPSYSVDDKPVSVFFGDTPLFRKLDNGDLTGADVAMVSDNLAALGYKSGGHPKDLKKAAFTPALVDALKRWQRHAGLDETGTLDVGQIVVLPGPVRVNSVTAQLGDAAASPLLTVTSTGKVVTMPVDATQVGQIKIGAAVTIQRPDSKEIPAKVTSISTTVDGNPSSAGSGNTGQGPPKVNVTVVPDNASDVADLDSASVQVTVTTESHPGVLAVPVGALVALREGGYAVQLPNGQLKAVRTGMFSKDLVEISGAGIVDGLQVETTS